MVGCASASRAGRSSGPATSFRHLEIGHEIISTAILSLPLIQVGAVVSYWRKDVHLVLVNHLGSLPRNSLIRLTDRLDMAIVVDWNVKPRTKQKQGRAMVLGSFQCRGVLLLRQMTRQGPAVLAAGAEWVGYVLFFIFKSRLSYLPFLIPHLLGDGWTFWNIVVSAVLTQQ